MSEDITEEQWQEMPEYKQGYRVGESGVRLQHADMHCLYAPANGGFNRKRLAWWKGYLDARSSRIFQQCS